MFDYTSGNSTEVSLIPIIASNLLNIAVNDNNENEKTIATIAVDSGTHILCEPVLLLFLIEGYALPAMIKYLNVFTNNQLPLPIFKIAQAALEYKKNIANKLRKLDVFLRISLAPAALISVLNENNEKINTDELKPCFTALRKMAGFSSFNIYELRILADEIAKIEAKLQQQSEGKTFSIKFNQCLQTIFDQLKTCKQHISFTVNYLHNNESLKEAKLGLPAIYYLISDLCGYGLNNKTWPSLREKLSSYFESVVGKNCNNDLPITFSELQQWLHQLYQEADDVVKKFKTDEAIEKIVIEKKLKKNELSQTQKKISLLRLELERIKTENKILIQEKTTEKNLLTIKVNRLQDELKQLLFIQEYIARKPKEKYGFNETKEWINSYLSHYYTNNVDPITSNKLLNQIKVESDGCIGFAAIQLNKQLQQIKQELFKKNTNSDHLEKVLSSLPEIAMMNKFVVHLVIEVIKEHYNCHYAPYIFNMGNWLLNTAIRLNNIKKYFPDAKIQKVTLWQGETIISLASPPEFSSTDLGNLIKDLNLEKSNASGSQLARMLTTIKTAWEKYEKPYWHLLANEYKKRVEMAKEGFNKIIIDTNKLNNTLSLGLSSCQTMKDQLNVLGNILEKDLGEKEFKKLSDNLEIVDKKIKQADEVLVPLQQLVITSKDNIQKVLNQDSILQQKYKNIQRFIKEEVTHFLRKSTLYIKRYRTSKLKLAIEKIEQTIVTINEDIIKLESDLKDQSEEILEKKLKQIQLKQKRLRRLKREAEEKLVLLNKEKEKIEQILLEKKYLENKIHELLADEDWQEIERSTANVQKLDEKIVAFDLIIQQIEYTKKTLSEALTAADNAKIITSKLITAIKTANVVNDEIKRIANEIEQQLTTAQNITKNIKNTAIEYKDKISSDLSLLNDPAALLEVQIIKGSIFHLSQEKNASAKKKLDKLEELLNCFIDVSASKNETTKQRILKKIHHQLDTLRLPPWVTHPLAITIIRWFATKILNKQTHSRKIYDQTSRELISIKNQVQNPDDKYQIIQQLVNAGLQTSWNTEIEKKVKEAEELQAELLERNAEDQRQYQILEKEINTFSHITEKYLDMVKLPFIIIGAQVEIKNEQWEYLTKPSGLEQLWQEMQEEAGCFWKVGKNLLTPIVNTTSNAAKNLTYAVVGELALAGCVPTSVAALSLLQTTVAKAFSNLIPTAYLGKFAESAIYSAMRITWSTECTDYSDKKDTTKNIVKSSFLFREVVSGRFYVKWFKGIIELRKNYEQEAKRLDNLRIELMQELTKVSDQLKNMNPYEFIGTHEELIKKHETLRTKLIELDAQVISAKKVYLIASYHYEKALKTVSNLVDTPLWFDAIADMKDAIENKDKTFGIFDNEWLPKHEKFGTSKKMEKLELFGSLFRNLFSQYLEESWRDNQGLSIKVKSSFIRKKVYFNPYQQMNKFLIDSIETIGKGMLGTLPPEEQKKVKQELPEVDKDIKKLRENLKNLKPEAIQENSTIKMNNAFKLIKPSMLQPHYRFNRLLQHKSNNLHKLLNEPENNKMIDDNKNIKSAPLIINNF